MISPLPSARGANATAAPQQQGPEIFTGRGVMRVRGALSRAGGGPSQHRELLKSPVTHQAVDGAPQVGQETDIIIIIISAK